ncbi:hypothetical protein F4553_008019 [Allocatelliglobosispora scoriae]|uniref:Uncharacterized protein n=1 Tax=Allocatelliglobosispora scoriae TaxID=643052 RepID=A0A841C3X2_9ACTN|nr:hypothetical protein [Allocatelliglobosispora scoriae]MBB5874585.1 hypothetical protein [Allocatelliglobosispora scoriae]
MRLMSCVACGRPVLDLPGQTVMLEPYAAVAGVPPVSTAGAWHLSCLASDPAAEQWGHAHVHSVVQVRRFDLIARVPEWAVVENPRTGDRLALGRLGAIVALRGRGITTAPAGLRVTVSEYWLEWDQPVIARIQAELRSSGAAAVLDVADLLGIRDRLTSPHTLADSAFRADSELIEEWTPTAVGAALDIAVALPPELHPLL